VSGFDQAGTGPIPSVKKATVAAEGSPDLQPTAITIPAGLTSVAADLDRCIETLTAVMTSGAVTITERDRELLVNTATAMKHIVEAAAGALGMLARAGIKPLEPAPTSPTIPESAA
jgi:hypothetical protein